MEEKRKGRKNKGEVKKKEGAEGGKEQEGLHETHMSLT